MRILQLPIFAAVVAVALFAAACSSDPEAREEMVLTRSCGKTACDRKSEVANSYCGACLSACSSASYDCDPSRACKASCGEHEVYCSDEDNGASGRKSPRAA